jgi:hypothetical protein
VQFKPVAKQNNLPLKAIFHVKMHQQFGSLVNQDYQKAEPKVFQIGIQWIKAFG